MRRVLVEIDKVRGTSWPPYQVNHGGLHSLRSIFAKAGISLTVRRGSANLPVPVTGRTFDRATLHEYLVRYRSERTSNWHAHVLIVPYIQYTNWSGKIVRPLGVMYDSQYRGDSNGIPREGCALSYAAIRGLGDPRASLRTLAHELGHVFNLVHPADDNPRRDAGTTIMNQTKILIDRGNFPNNIQYRFAPHNVEFLRRAPAEYVRPGGRPFGAWQDRGSRSIRDTADTASALTLTVAPVRSELRLGEPIYVRIELRNDSGAAVDVESDLGLSEGTLKLDVEGPDGSTRRFRPVVVVCGHHSLPRRLEPGQSIACGEPVFFGADGHYFDQPGEHRIQASYQHAESDAVQTLVSEPVTVHVRSGSSDADTVLCDHLSPPSSALHMLLGGGSHLVAGERSLLHAVEHLGDDEALAPARLSLATQRLRVARDSHDASRALELLGSTPGRFLEAQHARIQGIALSLRDGESSAQPCFERFQALCEDPVEQDLEGWVREGLATVIHGPT